MTQYASDRITILSEDIKRHSADGIAGFSYICSRIIRLRVYFVYICCCSYPSRSKYASQFYDSIFVFNVNIVRLFSKLYLEYRISFRINVLAFLEVEEEHELQVELQNLHEAQLVVTNITKGDIKNVFEYTCLHIF